MCNCINLLIKKYKPQFDFAQIGEVETAELMDKSTSFDGKKKTHSKVKVKRNGEQESVIDVIDHVYCPFCGEKY